MARLGAIVNGRQQPLRSLLGLVWPGNRLDEPECRNEASLREQLRRECTRARDCGQRLSVLVGSIELAPTADDRSSPAPALGTIANDLDKWTRRADSVAHLDASVFVVLLPDTGRAGAALAAKRLARTIHRYLDDQSRPGTVNFSHATYPDDGSDPDRLFDAALGSAVHRVGNRPPSTSRSPVTGVRNAGV
jgi:GGDEF domain-containing protein